ncbi:MAG: DUF3168 domain-containing protein [Yoonia sp.]|nr:DUF3168 domain-containing protein [Yoonia sp.]
MSYGVSAALQEAIFQHLYTDPDVVMAVGTNVFDALPSGTLPPLYVVLGPEVVKDQSDKTGAGALHELVVSVVTDAAGFAQAKVAAAAVSDALIDADLPLSRGALISLQFYKATAARVGTGDIRQINLIFRARVADV